MLLSQMVITGLALLKQFLNTSSWAQPKQMQANGSYSSVENTDTDKSNCTSITHSEIALIGNPNAGKTTLFNRLTGASQRTGNWPGVTVEREEGSSKLFSGNTKVIDLPGTYSLDGGDTSSDEKIARNFVLEHPDMLYFNIIDASTLELGLYLTLQLRELGVPIIVILNMMDVAKNNRMEINLEALGKQLSCPIVPVTLQQDKDLSLLNTTVCSYVAESTSIDVNYIEPVESAIKQLHDEYSLIRFAAINALSNKAPEHASIVHSIEQATNEDIDFLLADGRFQAANSMAQTVIK